MVTLGLYILLTVFILVLVPTLTYAVIIYNGFKRLEHNIERASSNIDVLLKQRYDEIPALVEIVKGYATHEKETIAAVIEARSHFNSSETVPEKAKTSEETSRGIQALFLITEGYPELRADRHFLDLKKRITEIEDHIADRREFYNFNVSMYNKRLQQFPDVMVARYLVLKIKPLFEYRGERG